jgi:DNA-binding NarL/FixJ family response regulator
MSFSARVLLVDDHEGWRRGVSSVLRTHRWQVVGEAEDGFDAVHQADALRPDVILLDIELPKMNGLEAARRILASHPSSRVLFVSGHRTWDVIEAAFATGGRGYLTKADVGHELLPAMKTIVEGKRFVSGTFTGRASHGRKGHAHKSPRHVVGFYSDDSPLADDFVRFGKTALDAGKTLVLVAVEPRRNDVRRKLELLGLDVERAIAERRYLSFDIADALSPFMVDGVPDEERFSKASISLLTRAAAAARCDPPGVAICGEGCASLFRDGNPEAAIRIEHLWDELARVFNVDVLCPYSLGGVAYDDASDVFRRLRDEHTAAYSR